MEYNVGPRVPSRMTYVSAMGQLTQFPSGQESIAGFLARPRDELARPAVILLSAIAGINDYIRDVAGRLAEQGYVCLAPDYHSREGSPPDLSDRSKIMEAVAALPDPRAMADTKAALAFLRSQPFVADHRVGVLGFCIGGSYALMAGAELPDLKCAISYYGQLRYTETTEQKPVSPIEKAEDIACPLLGHFGDADHLIPTKDVEELRERLKGHSAEIYIYPGAGHAFHEDFRPAVYRPVAAKTAWQRSLVYLDWYLRDSGE
jgi:dienelactone hydrolase